MPSGVRRQGLGSPLEEGDIREGNPPGEVGSRGMLTDGVVWK